MQIDENEVVHSILHLKPGTKPGPEQLFDWLGHESYRIRKAILQVLPLLSLDGSLVQALIKGLADENNSGLRNGCAEALILLGNSAVPDLTQAITYPDTDQRKFVIECLGRIPGQGAERALLAHVEQEDSNLRAAMLEALARHPSKRTGEVLLQQFHHLVDLDLQVQAAVLDALDRSQLVVPFAELAPLCSTRPLLRFIYPLLGRCEEQAALDTLLDGIGHGAMGTKKAALAGLISYMQQHTGSENKIHQHLQIRQAKPILLMLLRVEEEAIACGALTLMGHAYFVDVAYEVVAIGVKWGRQAEVYRIMLAMGMDVVPVLQQAFGQAGPTSQLTMLDIFAKFGVLARLLPQLEKSLSESLLAYAKSQLFVITTANKAVATKESGAIAPESRPSLSPPASPPVLPTQVSVSTGFAAELGGDGHKEQGKQVVLSSELYSQLRALVQRFCGIQLPADGGDLIGRRLRTRLALHKLTSFEQYLQLLLNPSSASQELTSLMDILTTNETYFFREMRGFEAFLQVFLPQWLMQHSPSESMHVWSAGCASGEEPYTLSMLLTEQRGTLPPTVSIVGTDISLRMLQSAREGIYRGMSLRETSPERLQRFFQPVGQGYQMKKTQQTNVRFAYFNLLAQSNAHLGWFDAIFCRNVFIYFSKETRMQVLDLFYRHLHPGGVLFLGHAESLLNVQTAFEPVCMRGEFVYRKPMHK